MINRRTLVLGTLALPASASVWAPRAFAGAPVLKVAAVKFGSVNWLLETIKAEGIDTKLGLEIAPVELANNQAGPISLLSGGSDIIVSDWPWALRQRGLGEPLKFAPYSATLGGVMVASPSPVNSLTDLAGKRLGVAGSSIDKSWLLLQAYAKKMLNFDIANKATIQFGAAPLLTEQVRDGGLDAALNFWTQNMRLSSLGFREVLSMSDVLKGLGVNPVPAFVGFIWKEQTEATKLNEIVTFLAAASAANEVLAKSDAAWARLKPIMKAGNDAEFAKLRAAYCAGIVPAWREADMKSAERIMQLLIEQGDTELVGAKTTFDPKLVHVQRA